MHQWQKFGKNLSIDTGEWRYRENIQSQMRRHMGSKHTASGAYFVGDRGLKTHNQTISNLQDMLNADITIQSNDWLYQLTDHVFSSRYTGALCRAERTAITEWRLFRSSKRCKITSHTASETSVHLHITAMTRLKISTKYTNNTLSVKYKTYLGHFDKMC